MSPIGLGNDIGGSLRNPAHCCGIASLKPTVGVIPMATVIPPERHAARSQMMVVEGPMARRVADVRAGFTPSRARTGATRARSRSRSPTPARPSDSRRRAADPPGGTTDPGIAAAIRTVADRLADAGHDVVEATRPTTRR